MKFDRQFNLLFLLLSVLLLTSTACRKESAVGDDDHDHSEHEADHHFPDHHPRQFHAAVRRLETIDRESKGEAKRPKFEVSPATELADIGRWLPMLAADTDMPEAEWNQVVIISRSLQDIADECSDGISIDPGHPSSATNPSTNEDRISFSNQQRMAFEKQLIELKKLFESTPKPRGFESPPEEEPVQTEPISSTSEVSEEK